MAVVRREGAWRLERREEGRYEVTYENQPEVVVVTAEYDRGADAGPGFSLRVEEVESAAAAEAVFEDLASGSPARSDYASRPGLTDDEGDVRNEPPNLPPAAWILIGFVGGGYLISQSGLALDSPLFLVGVVFVAAGGISAGFVYRVYARDGARSAAAYLLTPDETDAERTDSG